MRVPALRNIIVAALASTALGGSTACEDCVEHSDAHGYAVSPSAFRAGSFAAMGAATYEEWVDLVAHQPCETVCHEFISESPITVDRCEPLTLVEGTLMIHCEWTYRYCESQLTSGCGSGRRPPGFSRAPAPASGDVRGAFYARLAELESASVAAFEIVARDLANLGAPAHLVRGALRAARDEVRHARAMALLARRFGTNAVEARVDASEPRSLETFATDNVVEGCARETYGAALTTWMAEAAPDPHVKAAMRAIARDETRHAALSWQIARWTWGRLDGPARRRVASARAAAVTQLARELDRSPPRALIDEKLAPPAAIARAMLASLERGLRHTAEDVFRVRRDAA